MGEDAVEGHPTWEMYRSASGRGLVAKDIEAANLPKAVRIKMYAVMARVARGEGHDGDVKNLGRGLRELRISGDRVIYRLLFSHEGSVNVMLGLYFFGKTSRKTPQQAIDTALTRRSEWRRRRDERK